MSKDVMVLGGTGMLGIAVVRVLSDAGFPVVATTRNLDDAPADLRHLFVTFDVTGGDLDSLLAQVSHGGYVVNCIGVIKPYIHDDVERERRRALVVNSLFPYELSSAAERAGLRVIQIATDCVYDGARGSYDERDQFNAIDVYGKTKSLGEVPADHFLNLRCSVIGPELKGKTSLLEWVLSHPSGSHITGYVDHHWNGLTGQAFGRVVAGIVMSGNELSGTHHVVPNGVVSKADLCRIILEAYARSDVSIILTESGNAIDRTLSTLSPDVNARLWRDAGYALIPTVERMVHDLLVEAHTIGEAL